MDEERTTVAELVDRATGTEEARETLKILLQSMAGDLSVEEACERLQVSEERFDELWLEAMQGMVPSMEPKPEDAAEAERLLRRAKELEVELAVSRFLKKSGYLAAQ